MYADKRFTVAEKDVLAWLAVKAVFSGRDTFRIRQCTVSDRTGAGERTIRRAYKRARDLGYLVVMEERQRGRGHTRADEYRLLVPTEIPYNLASTPEEIPDTDAANTGQDCTKYRTELPEIPDTADAVTCDDDTPISSL